MLLFTECRTRVTDFEPFNCSQKSSDFQKLLNAKCNATRLTECLKPGRRVFSMNKDRYGNLTCSNNNVVPVCRLSWCKYFRYIRKNEIPGEVICSGFTEPYVSPTTTAATTSATSSKTSTTSITSSDTGTSHTTSTVK